MVALMPKPPRYRFKLLARDGQHRPKQRGLVVGEVAVDLAPPAGELVVHEVERPARVRHRRRSQRRPRPDGATPSLALAHREALGAVKPVDLVAARRLAVAPQ